MIKILLISFFIFISSFANESLILQKQNILYVQNLIDKEEKIAQSFENYLLTEFAIPKISDLQTDEYLGENFSIENMMGDSLALDTETYQIRLKYAISKDTFIKKITGDTSEEYGYLIQLYNRDLYRDYTKAEFNAKKLSESYAWFDLKSQEAKNIYKILKSPKATKGIAKQCSSALINQYCNNNLKSIRYYDGDSSWIEYNKKDYLNGNVTVSSDSIRLTKSNFNDLKVGAYIFVKDKEAKRYIKYKENPISADTPENFKILKVE